MPTRPPVLLHRLKSAAAGLMKAISRSAHRASTVAPGSRPDTIRSTLFPPTRIIRSAISRRFLMTVNENGAEVVDVRERGTRAQQIAQALEETRGVVVGKKRGRIEAELPCPRGGFAVDRRAGRILRRAFAAVGAVGVAGKRRDALCAGEFDRQREGIFLVRPAAARAPDRHRELAAREDDAAAAGSLELARFCGVRDRNRACLAFDIRPEQDAVVAGGLHGGLGG